MIKFSSLVRLLWGRSSEEGGGEVGEEEGGEGEGGEEEGGEGEAALAPTGHHGLHPHSSTHSTTTSVPLPVHC